MSDQLNQLTPVDGHQVETLCAERGLSAVAVHSVLTTESTNADAVELVRGLVRLGGARANTASDIADYNVVVTATQTAGRGRLTRKWIDQGGDSLLFSLVSQVPPAIAPEYWGWIPLLAGMAVTSVLRTHGVAAKTKWPNDVIIEDRDLGGVANTKADDFGVAGGILHQTYKKLVGILSEAVDGYVVVGIGVNLTANSAQLPDPNSVSALGVGGVNLTRELILAEILVEFNALWQRWVASAGDAALAQLDIQYCELSATIGAQVQVSGFGSNSETSRNSKYVGLALAVDQRGQLVIEIADGVRTAISVGDIQHLRH